MYTWICACVFAFASDSVFAENVGHVLGISVISVSVMWLTSTKRYIAVCGLALLIDMVLFVFHERNWKLVFIVLY